MNSSNYNLYLLTCLRLLQESHRCCQNIRKSVNKGCIVMLFTQPIIIIYSLWMQIKQILIHKSNIKCLCCYLHVIMSFKAFLFLLIIFRMFHELLSATDTNTISRTGTTRSVLCMHQDNEDFYKSKFVRRSSFLDTTRNIRRPNDDILCGRPPTAAQP